MQVPQFILDAAFEGGTGAQCNIICTQPRHRIPNIPIILYIICTQPRHRIPNILYPIPYTLSRIHSSVDWDYPHPPS